MGKPCRAPKVEAEEAKNRQRAEDQGVWQKVAMIGLWRERENEDTEDGEQSQHPFRRMDVAAKREEPEIVDAQQNPNGGIRCPAKHGGVNPVRHTASQAIVTVHGEIDLTSKTS